MNINQNGLTYERWLAAAKEKPSMKARHAWIGGECPWDYRYVNEQRARAKMYR